MQAQFKGENHHLWKGGRFIDAKGYIRIYAPNHQHEDKKGYVKEHLAVAEQVLNKKLPPKAVVHHIDGNKQNNNKNNLLICENETYHHLIHSRTDALLQSGDTKNLFCYVCKRWLSRESFGASKRGSNRQKRAECFDCRKTLYQKKIKNETSEERLVRLERMRINAKRHRDKKRGIKNAA